jgi:hypothetical protein
LATFSKIGRKFIQFSGHTDFSGNRWHLYCGPKCQKFLQKILSGLANSQKHPEDIVIAGGEEFPANNGFNLVPGYQGLPLGAGSLLRPGPNVKKLFTVEIYDALGKLECLSLGQPSVMFAGKTRNLPLRGAAETSTLR